VFILINFLLEGIPHTRMISRTFPKRRGQE
jgi:hypothetical protein